MKIRQRSGACIHIKKKRQSPARLVSAVAALLSANTLPLSQAQAFTTEVVPGLNLYPTDVTCCPTLPLMGPAWMVDSSSLVTGILDSTASEPPCSLLPSWERPMVVVFQPNGVVNGWADTKACHYIAGSYSIAPSGKSFEFDFSWHRFQSQPYSCPATHCSTPQVDAFWQELSSRVATLVLTGHTNVELRDRDGHVVVRLEALADSYSCNQNQNNQRDDNLCDSQLQIPKPELMGSSLLPTSSGGYTPEELAMGGGGVHDVGEDGWRAIDRESQSSATIGNPRFGGIIMSMTAAPVAYALFH